MSSAGKPLAPWVRYAAPLLVALVMLALWQMLVSIYALPTYIVPSPAAVAHNLVEDRALLLGSLSVTLSIALVALAVALVVGVLIAVTFAQSRWIEASLYP